MNNYEEIKTFVRNTLGCGCPDEVFRIIECQSSLRVHDIVLRSRLNIGNRLLIYIAEIDDTDVIKEVLPILVDAGKKERNRLGFNRLRIVVAAHSPEKIRNAAEALFSSANKDEKIHLHIIDTADIPAFS
ncbi:MAG: hypothetical protein AB1552_03175 [Nitrospirota bacterium]